jgi:proton-coupled amino acid transporter
VLPIESSMAKPHKFGSIFFSAMVVTALAYVIVGCVCVAAFGPVTNGSVTAFLLDVYADQPHIRWLLLAANAAVSLSVLVTYPLQLFPCLELVMQMGNRSLTPMTLFARMTGSNFQSVDTTDDNDNDNDNENDDSNNVIDGLQSEVASDFDNDSDNNDNVNHPNDPLSLAYSWKTRTVLVFLTYSIAILIPNVQSLISLAGALAGSSTALLIPPFLELAWLERSCTSATSSTSTSVGMDDNGIAVDASMYYINYNYKRWRAYAMLAGGVVFLCIGTGASLLDIARDYSN